ncbi:unnamed protein product, partial [Prorocentrum cordatum]
SLGLRKNRAGEKSPHSVQDLGSPLGGRPCSTKLPPNADQPDAEGEEGEEEEEEEEKERGGGGKEWAACWPKLAGWKQCPRVYTRTCIHSCMQSCFLVLTGVSTAAYTGCIA